MRLNRFERALPDGTCNAGKVYYACQINSFKGCCSVDPCALPACPDTDSSSTTAPVSKSTSQPTPRQTLISIPNSVLSSTLATATIKPTSIIVDISITSSTPTHTRTQTQTPSSIPSLSPASGVPNTPIIAGTVSGVVVLSILSILLWFCLRRRKQNKEIRNSIVQYDVPNKKYVLDRSAPSESVRVGGDVFAPFGGRHDEPHLTSATPPLRSGQSTPKQAPTSSREVHPAAAVGFGSGSGQSDPTTPIADRPLPDPEKSTITPPPVHEHPFFHPLPGQSAEIPTYHPGTPVNPNLTPIAPLKSTMRSHPTYHISQLTTHPVFRASKPPSPPRESGFPQRTPEVRKYRSLSPVQSSSRHQSQNQAYEQQQNQQACRHSHLSSTTSNALTSPVLGRSELEADVPSTYLSPVTTTYNTPSADFDYTNKYTQRRSLMTPISRGNTDSSKYSIPIGLGVESNLNSTSTLNPKSDSSSNRDRDRKSSPPLQYRNSEIRHDLDPPTPDLAISPLSISTQMIGPLGPNLNSPRDGGHVMSWASEGYGHGHGHGYSSPPTWREHEREWAQEGVYRPSDEKEVVSPMTPERWSGATAVHMSSSGGAGVGNATPLSAESDGLSPEAGTGTWGSWSGR
ncbi:hypothetical protein BKA61DRAFT_586756 [Leptodontidium sp. MPI-SDFR-AT-0119]|nr:hypothetical protein BKA61DRAFT_586756 [Leptodontidium sp. MPI-SDFR-AT-0119]